ncbi:helix-turn-helix domain-containing protein [Natrialbaceae archaeon A-arb3/5]
MSVIAEFTVPANAVALGETFEAVDDLTVEIERLATHSREWIMPFLWATNDDFDDVSSAFQSDPTIDEFELLDTESNIGYYNLHWSESVQKLIDKIVNQHGIIQEAEATDGVWFFKLKFVNRQALEGFQRYFHEQDFSFELQRLHDGTMPKEREYNLTPEQRETMVTALEMGYFSVPRETQISELAAELDISTNAVSQRLRRATANLTRNTLTISSERVQTF